MNARLSLAVLGTFTLLAACVGDYGSPAEPAKGPADPGDAGSIDAATPPDGGAASPDAPTSTPTLYAPKTYATLPPVTRKVTYPNFIAGEPGITETERTVGIAIYRPVGAPTPAPVVILAHGGGDGLSNPLTAMEDWSPVIASAGYVAIAIAFTPRSTAERAALCAKLGNVDNPCGVSLNWDRPSDVGAVIDSLEANATKPELAGLDLTRIATLSHSAGSGAMQFVGGMTTSYKCMRPYGQGQHDCQAADLLSRRDPRVKAIAVMSPQGPDGFGFIAPISFDALAVPMLIANRKKLFGAVPPGDRFLFWIEGPGSRHSFFNHQLDECATETTAAQCKTMQTWLEASVFAFLDYRLRGDLAARDWLKSPALSTISAGVAQPQSK
jgi:hypothetical protein